MIFELRTYTLINGQLEPYMKLFREDGMAIRGNAYGKLEGLWTTEFGTVGQVHHLWSYEDILERDHARERLRVEQPRWLGEYVPTIRMMNQPEQENAILRLVSDVPLTPPPGERHIYEMRTYQLIPNGAPEWVSLFKKALPDRQKHSPLVGLWVSDIGPLNQIYHLWAYDDLNQRMEARARAAQEPSWQEFERATTDIVVTRRANILISDACSPLR